MSKLDPCPREDELLDALGAGYVGPELTEHVNGCTACSELHLVAGAVLSDRVDAVAEANVPSSGTMLFKMQMRYRREAQATARRSLLVGQAMTLAVAVIVVVAVFGADIAFEMKQAIAAIRVSTPLLIAFVTTLLLAPIGYVAIRQK